MDAGHHGHSRKDAKEVVIPMTGPSIRQYYNRLLFSIGIRNQKKRRHEFSVHSLRKYFKTRAEQAGMKPINVEVLMGHSVGISDSYYRLTESELQQDYLGIVDRLNVRLEAKSADTQLQLQQKDNRIGQLQRQMAVMEENIKQIIQTVNANFEAKKLSFIYETTEEHAKQLEMDGGANEIIRKKLQPFMEK